MRKNDRIICNCCGKEFMIRDGFTRESVISIDYIFGFFSEKDGEKHSFDLCEKCYDQLTTSFKIPVSIEEMKELL